MTDEKVKVKRLPGGGRKPLLQTEHLEVLHEIVSTHPLDSLGELTARLVERTGLQVSSATVRQALKRLGFVLQVVPHVEEMQGDSELSLLEGETKRQSDRCNESHRFQASEWDYPSSLTNAEWTVISPIFEIPESRGKPPKYPRRLMVNAMLYVVRGGISWRKLPSEFPPWHQVFKTFQRWAAQGRFEKMYDRLRAMIRERADRSIEPTAAVIDSQGVKTSPQGGPKGYDAGKKV